MGGSADDYVAFQERLRRTIYLDNLSPMVTDVVLNAALDQFCNVVNIQFIPNYMNPQTLPRAALVEVMNENEASRMISNMAKYPLMIGGMPRPVRARAAVEAMFDDRPKKPGRRITFQWLDADDPNFKNARTMNNLTRKHAAEVESLLNRQLADEEKLAKQQAETLKANYKKYELIEGVVADGTANKLAQHYNISIVDA